MAIEPHLPALRRYARAAMGSSRLGDAVLASCLPRLAREARDRDGLLRGLIAALDCGSLARMAAPGDLPGAIARLPPLPRHALLLTLLERLPADHAALLLGVTPGEVAEALAQARGALAPLRPARILIIGDGRGTLAQLVQGLGHAVCAQVANEDAAWQAAARTRPDLVLAEAALPDGGCGLAAVQRIAANDAVPVVLVGEDALAAHGFPLLRRPWRAEALRHAIGRALRGRHGRAG
jgi:CheY-like chemotaxis protein